jgi:hypothetical protein
MSVVELVEGMLLRVPKCSSREEGQIIPGDVGRAPSFDSSFGGGSPRRTSASAHCGTRDSLGQLDREDCGTCLCLEQKTQRRKRQRCGVLRGSGSPGPQYFGILHVVDTSSAVLA